MSGEKAIGVQSDSNSFPARLRSALALLICAMTLSGVSCSSAVDDRVIPIGLHRLKIGETEFAVEIAADSDRRMVGLMYRTSLPEDRGMLFIFPEPQLQSFYMKNCEIDLDIAYIDDDGKIIDILLMKHPPKGFGGPYTHYRSSKPVRYVLEMNAGWFRAHDITVGATVEGYRGPPNVRVR